MMALPHGFEQSQYQVWGSGEILPAVPPFLGVIVLVCSIARGVGVDVGG